MLLTTREHILPQGKEGAKELATFRTLTSATVSGARDRLIGLSSEEISIVAIGVMRQRQIFVPRKGIRHTCRTRSTEVVG